MLVRVTWRIVLSEGPARCRRFCARCSAEATFTSSGRFRVNTNGKRVDVWLVYNCDGCGRSWNSEILERASVRSLAPATYEKFLQNDVTLARRYELDEKRLNRQGARMDSLDFEIYSSVLRDEVQRATSIEITLHLPAPGAVSVRLDRALALGLGLSRREVRELGKQGQIKVVDARSRRALERSVVNRQRVVVVHGQ